MLSRRALTSAATLLALFVTCNVVAARRPANAQSSEMSLEEMTRSSSAVVVGTATKKRSYWNEGQTKIYTSITISVDERVTGDVQDETIVTVPGGRIGNTLYEVSDMPVFVEGEEVLLFLWRHPTGPNLVTGGAHGKLEVFEDIHTGKKTLRGAAHLTEPGLSKAGVAAEREASNVPLDEFIARIKAGDGE